MADITAWVTSLDDIFTETFEGVNGWSASIVLDGVRVYVSDPLVPRAERDASIIATTDHLILALAGLRDAAVLRIADADETDLSPLELAAVNGDR